MSVKNPKELFVILLSDVRQGAERMTAMRREMSQIAEDAQIKDALEESEFVAGQTLEKLDQCFKLIGEKPIKPRGRIREVLLEDFQKEVSEISSPLARHLYVLSKGIQLIHLRIAEYVALIAASEITGNHAVRELLESCLADKLAAVERVRRLIRTIVETKVRERAAA